MKTITSKELAKLINENTPIQLIDVREFHEHERYNIGGEIIPFAKITQYLGIIEKKIPVIVYCKKGLRSHIAIQRLELIFPFENLFNLSGGIDEWKKYLAK